MVTVHEISKFLDDELNIKEIEDSSNNGLQVENVGEVKKVAFAVDASLAVFEKAVSSGCQMVVVHHGMIWEGIKYVTGNDYQRIKYLIDNNLAVYAAHLPLDMHPKHGNNIKLAKMLGLKHLEGFGEYKGSKIGFVGDYSGTLENVKKIMQDNGMDTNCWSFGKQEIKKIALISGGGLFSVKEAAECGVDLFITGDDSKYSAYAWAQELGLNVIIGGHYKTEVWGVQALMELVEKKFKVEVGFIDMPIPI
jgi:dinuclear metal center YbgI/SA1388 family protein